MSHRRYLMLLGGLFAVVWVASAINPLHPEDWLLENVLVALFVLGVILTTRWFVFSRVSMSM